MTFLGALMAKKESALAGDSRKLAYYSIAHTIYGTLAAPFEIVLALRLSGSFQKIVYFYLALYILLYVSFFAGIFMLRNGKASRSFRLDLILQASSCFYVVILFPLLGNPLVLAGIFVLKGASEGLFWSARHSAMIVSVHDSGRDKFMLSIQTVQIILSIFLPALSGLAISFIQVPLGGGDNGLPSGYFAAFLFSGCVISLALAFSPKFRIPRQSLAIDKLLIPLRHKENLSWAGFLLVTSISSIAVTISVGILNFTILKREYAMGFFTSAIALASAGFFFIMRRVLANRPANRIALSGIGAVSEFISRFLYIVFPTLGGLIGKSLADGFLVPLKSLFGENILRLRLEQCTLKLGISRGHAILYQETVVFAGRMVIILFLILILNWSTANPEAVARVVLLAFMASGMLEWLLLTRINLANKQSKGNTNVQH